MRVRKNPFVSFGSIVSEARLQRVVVRSRWHAKQREEVEGVSRATNQPSESNTNRWERAQIENGRRGRDRPSRSDALHASIFIPLINSILVVHRSFIRTFVSLYLTVPRQPSLSRLSLSFCRVRTFIHLLSVLPAARVLSTRCFSSLSILSATLVLSFSYATVLPLFLLRPCLAILLLVLVRSLSRATSHVAPTHSCFPTNDTHPHDRYQ